MPGTVRPPSCHMKSTSKLWSLATALGLITMPLAAAVQVTDNPDLTTNPNFNPFSTGVGSNDGTGIWFNPLTGYAESRGYTYPSTFFEDGQFWLMWNNLYVQPAAELWTQGFFSRGNGVVYESSFNLNPKRFGDGETIGPGVGYQNPGAGFTDLGPTFGNWAAGGRGYLGLTLRDPSGSSSSDIFYGYAEINVNPDYSITLLSFAYNDVRGEGLTTVPSTAVVPEPSLLALAPVGALALALGLRRRQAR